MRWSSVIFVCVCLVQVVIGTRSKRLVIAQGRDGVGEVLRVDEQEYERLVSQGVKVVRGEVVANATEKNVNVEGNVEEEEEHEEDEIQEFGNATAVAVPEDVMRGGNVDRKVPGKHEPPGADLSFTGLLNGLLDSFINEPPSPPSRPQPLSPPSPPTTPASLEENSNQDDEEEDELLEEEQEIPEHNQQEISNEDVPEDTETETDDAPPPPTRNNSKACAGECRNIIFGLFLCDEIDNDSYCPESLACCVNNAPPSPPNYNRPINTSSEEDSIVLDNNHDLPEIELPPDTVEEQDDEEEEDEPTKVNNEPARLPAPPPPPPPQQQMYMFNRPPPFRNPQPPPHMYYPNKHVMPPPQLQKLPYAPCPRYCVKNFLEQHCPHRLPSNFACGVDAFCCESNVVEPPKEEVLEEEPEIEEQTGTKVLGPCTEEVGSCVNVHVINIICFAHATPTDMYTCPRSSMKCCARKTALPKDATPAPPTTQQPITNSITRNASSIIPKNPLPPPPQLMTPQQPATFPQQIAPVAPPQPPVLAETPPPLTLPSYGTSQRTRTPIAQYVCGVKGPGAQTKRRRKRVVGGRDSLPGEWCWQVALINSLNQYLCGGALIGTQWVLTAAHCVTNIVRSGDAIYVRVGDHDLTSRYGSPGAQTLRVATTYIHHNHNSQTLDNDIALLKLQGNAALKEGVCLVCLPSRTQNEVPGKRCTVTGYGYMGESGPIPLRIREALLPIVSDDECVKKVNAVTEKVFALPMSSFCAGGDQSGHDACQGDGGGPLVCTSGDDRAPGYYELTGLVSWGFGCGRENVPGVYVKVSSFIGWIHQIIRSN